MLRETTHNGARSGGVARQIGLASHGGEGAIEVREMIDELGGGVEGILVMLFEGEGLTVGTTIALCAKNQDGQNPVKEVVQFHGREIAHVDLGKKLLLLLSEDLREVGAVEGEPKLEGGSAHIIVSPVKAAVPAAKPKEKAGAPKPPSAPPA